MAKFKKNPTQIRGWKVSHKRAGWVLPLSGHMRVDCQDG